MAHIVVDELLTKQLRDMYESCFLVDAAGNTLGMFLPGSDCMFYEGYEFPLTKEKLDEIEREGGGRPLAEILCDLEKES